MDIPHLFIHQLMEIWIISVFLAITNNAAVSIHLQVFVDIVFFICLGKYLKV